MAYLESKHCVHRDLAARNVLLTDNERTVKICDFGLMRALEDHQRLYVMSAQKKVPFAWCPPESLRLRQFSHASDVWAFGVTLWEMFSYGEEPWAGYRGAEVLAKTEAGERLARPQRCSNELYDLMASCWHLKAEERPRFSLLKSLLGDIKFMIAEARETCVPTKDMDLEMRPNDRLIVIDGSGSVWYGQNVRTRNFGHFARSSIHAKSERSPTITSTNGLMSPMSANTTGVERISKPVPGSFIHAGHGDINPGQSWGQPQRIDDIYLKNPILRNEDEMRSGSGPRRLGPQIIPSVIDIYPATVSSAPSGQNPPDEKQLPAKKCVY
uniref:Non-specific protein-tyrosine kinase n=1 Tax=Ascaris lumbricoides TaxID=6252 RepID=A0A0M3ISH6_ASCLU